MVEGSSETPEGCRKDDPFWSFDDVQERLVQAYGFLRRMPDREAAWLRTSISSLYRQINPLAGLSAIELRIVRHEREQEAPRLPPLTRDQVSEMEEALGWLEWIDGDRRKIVHMAVAQLASGRQTRIAWGSLASDPTLPGSADRLRMAYGRAITDICKRLNAASNLGYRSSSPRM